MKAIAHERRRFGYRRVQILLKREGYVVNNKYFPDDRGLDRQIGSTWPFWRSPPFDPE
jgi:hypothetical protein